MESANEIENNYDTLAEQ